MTVPLLQTLIDSEKVVAVRPLPSTRYVKADLSFVGTGDIQAMRLLNVNTRKLEEFFGDSIPPYAILSHTWGKEEVSLQDLSREGHQQKQGYGKIEGCCQQAIKDRLLWVWVDTCCIDKTSSAELSEAINSMFRWYQHSRVCYAYLQDVPSGTDVYAQGSAFRKSRWFTRGWTLQELLVPQKIEFYDTNWTHIFLLNTINYPTTGPVDIISDITSIDYATFRHYNVLSPVSSVPAACVFSWMARRSTTRVEDEAYCLLGLLNINMPLLYGEGEKAFIRLQEAILSGSDDISPLAWGYHSPYMRNMSYLARSPAVFIGYPKKYDYRRERIPTIHTTVTGHGLHIELRMILVDKRSKVWLGIVEEGDLGTGTGIAIVLQQIRNLGSKVPQFAKDMHWQHYFAARNVTTNEIGYVYATDGPRNRRGEIESCDLWWKKGFYS
ncbi:hypothetical protein J4E90_007556 [Alternaria incomplexa]|uniref:uncharacterized protein n=1 Tax=Alternaria incomplexa TaxID=1187928 RepID=UPI0022211975|nr:uncharacterized protein J4E90_007556 [Alternaria incomplexa]KAI4910125.1 hypothetical protein J4E90_007556 [Alternaria incomplexa]